MTSFRREDLLRALPYARRYARALSGGQVQGDALVTEAIRGLLAGEDGSTPTPASPSIRVSPSGPATRRPPAPGMDGACRPTQRKLLLLTSLEEVPLPTAAAILGLTGAQAEAALASARDRLRLAAATDVLIIEDEPIIAMDIEELVASCGHRVVGVAATEARRGGHRRAVPPGADPGRHQPGRRRRRHLRRVAHPAQPLRPRDLRHRLSGAAAHRRGARARLRHHQAVRAADARHRHLSGRHRRGTAGSRRMVVRAGTGPRHKRLCLALGCRTGVPEPA